MIEIIARLRDWLGGAPCRIPAHPETMHAVCYACGVFHSMDRNIEQGYLDFRANHQGHAVALLPAAHPQFMECSALRPNADIKLAYGASTALTMTLASLASGSAREATAIDNGTNKYLDALLYFAIPLQTGTPSSDKTIYIYVYGSEDGTNYTDNASGTDAAITLRSPTNLQLAGRITTPDAGALTYKSMPIPVASPLLPRKWGPVIKNVTGVAFNATEGNLVKTYSGVYATSI